MVSAVVSQQEGPWFKMPVLVLSGYSGFLLQSKERQVKSVGHSKFPLDMNVCQYLSRVQPSAIP